MSRGTRNPFSDDRGSALVVAIIVLPVMVLMLGFVIDVGNWFVHKRHLQTQADAAVLAAAGDFAVPCSDAAIIGRARQYAGLAAYAGAGPFNQQIGKTPPANLQGLINSATFYGQSSPTDPDVATGTPCATSMIDMKLTESNVPFFFSIGQLAHVNAQARAEIRKLNVANNFLPLSVSEAKWKTGEVTYLDQTSGTPGTVLAKRPIVENGTTAAGQQIWDNSAAPYTIPFSSAMTKVGVRVALSTTASTTCGDTGVKCYDDVLFARGYPGTPAVTTGGTPKLRDVGMSGGSCDDGYFTTTATTTGASCTVTISARVDWGVPNPQSTYTGSVTATLNGGTPVDLTYTAGVAPSPNTSTWTGTLTLPASGGPLWIDIATKATKGTIGGTACGNGNGKNPAPCTASFAKVQRTFSSSTTGSGPIQIAQLWRTSGTYGVNNFQCDPPGANCNVGTYVKIAVPGSLKAAQDANSDPVYRMRPLDGNSQTHLLDCDRNIANAQTELAQGCTVPGYVINSGQACSGYNNPAALPDPSPCAITQTGQSASTIGKGLNERILGDPKANSCTSTNHWQDFGTATGLSPSDPRIVNIILTDYDTFTGNGNEGFPVRQFAAFYITGWQGNSGFDNPCQKNGVSPKDDAAAAGEVVGHFIKYVQKVNNGGAGDALCDLSGTSLGLCVPVLTR